MANARGAASKATCRSKRGCAASKPSIEEVRAAMREALKAAAHAARLDRGHAVGAVLVESARAMMGPDRALEGSTQAWALVPGLIGQYLRRAFLSRTLQSCARTATIEFGTMFSSASASIGERAYIGPRCHLGWALIERDVLLAAGVHVPSGAHTHGIDDPTIADSRSADREDAGSHRRRAAGSAAPPW